MKICSWNVNGLRSVLGKGFIDYWQAEQPDILCLQEIKAMPDQVDMSFADGCFIDWNSAQRKGYSGTLTLSRKEPLSVSHGIGEPVGDAEGRVQTLEYKEFYLVNVYTPNAKGDLSRLEFRTQVWDPAFRKHLSNLQQNKPVLFCGDLNVAHQEIDLANPKSNRRNAGFTDEERAAFGEHLDAGFVDTFRLFEQGGGHYSWWSYRAGARSRNVGWRIDYVGVSKEATKQIQSAFIRNQVMGSDHCPVGVEWGIG
jgi:exodeoxyribonuclease-3